MQVGTFFSWTIYDKNNIIKAADKSVYIDGGSGIPKATRWFWGVSNIQLGDNVPVILFYNSRSYPARITLSNGRTRIFWPTFVHTLRTLHPTYDNCDADDFPSMHFQRIDSQCYEVTFADGTVIMPVVDLLNAGHVEGQVRYFYSKKYERNAKNRKDCIRIHGKKCSVCGFDFEAMYGGLGLGYIEVHHRKALYTLEEKTQVNPETDLVPVCANCHRMLHRNREYVLSIEELKSLLLENPAT